MSEDQEVRAHPPAADRAGQASPGAASASPPSGDHPLRNAPAWLTLAADTIAAVAFQRATRGVHVVGKDGRVRLGCVDLLGMYAVDEMMRQWAAYLGCEVPKLTAPTEDEAMRLLASGGTWRDCLRARDAHPKGGDDLFGSVHGQPGGEAMRPDAVA